MAIKIFPLKIHAVLCIKFSKTSNKTSNMNEQGKLYGIFRKVGVDLGTANSYYKRKRIVLREPSVVAVDNESNEILAVGEEARQMLGRTS